MAGTLHSDELVRSTLAAVAPGTELRDGLERILRGRTGALIVLGYDERVETICDGGFALDVRFAPTRLRELAKMDGAVVLSTDGERILRVFSNLNAREPRVWRVGESFETMAKTLLPRIKAPLPGSAAVLSRESR